ncbi:hypothetical protein [Meiothermus rufus]|uniref:hypothetical protein n=1 Tax=Meiothermus rufus TaxID=604332 RepID=UPI0004208C5B|nr:hypothetical protein [Meiothermus rufus]
MRIYRQSSKPLDELLGREERLVYALCQQEVSDVVLAQRTGLALDRLSEILEGLEAKGLLELLAATPPEQPQPPTPSRPDLAEAKAQLVQTLQHTLGRQASRYLAEIEAATSLSELEERALKLALKLRLTVSQEAAQALEAHANALFK